MNAAKRLTALCITLLMLLLAALPAGRLDSLSAHAADSTLLTVTGDIVNIRSGAGTSYSKLTTVTRSTVLTSLGTAKDASGAVWHKVSVGGTTGYISGAFVSAATSSSSTQTLTVTGSTVYVRKGAGTSYAYITVVKKGATYKVMGSAKDSSGKVWYKISINNTTGYIISTYVSVSGGTGGSTTTTAKGGTTTTAKPKTTQQLTVKGDVVNVRKGAGTNKAKVASVKKGAKFTVLGSSKDSSGKVWYKINVNGVTGYIISTYVTVTDVTTTTKTTTTTTKTTTAATTPPIIVVPGDEIIPTPGQSTTTTTTVPPTTAGGPTLAANISVQIVSGSVEMLSGAGAYYSKMTTLEAGDIVVILSNRTDSDNVLWYCVSYGAASGYVRASDLINSTTNAPSTTTTTTTASSTATTASTTTGTNAIIVVPGDSGEIEEFTTTTAPGDAVRTVKIGNVKCDSTLNVRTGPGTGFGTAGSLNNNAQVVIVETSGDWYKIEYGAGYGYVLSQYITNVRTGTVSVRLAFAKDYFYVNVGATINVGINLSGYTVSYSSANSAGASISSSGVVTGKTPGLYTITATAGSAKTTAEVVVLKAPYSDVQPMTISAQGTAFIAAWEGGGTPLDDTLVFYPYQDVSGYWTVGYGHAITSPESKKWSKEQAIASFNADITALLGEGHEISDEKPYLTLEEATNLLTAEMNNGPYVSAVSNWAVRNGVLLSQQQFDALVSFCYNLGPAYWNSDTYYFYLKSAIIAYRSGSDAVPAQIIEGFTRYIKSDGKNLKGLWWRRRNEAEMFLEGDYSIDRENKFTLPNLAWS